MNNELPGPRGLIALISLIFKRARNPVGLYEYLFNRYGSVVSFGFGSFRYLLVKDPKVVEQVLVQESKKFQKSFFYQRFRLIIGDGLLTSEGELWQNQRKMVSKSFSNHNLRKIFPTIREEVECLGERLRKNTDTIFELSEEMNRTTLEIMSHCFFGQSQKEKFHIVRNSMKKILLYLTSTKHLWIQLFVSVFPIRDKKQVAIEIEKKLPFKSSKDFFSSIVELRSIVEEMITERKKSAVGKDGDLLDVLISSTDDDNKIMSHQLLVDEVLTLLLAGHETTATALTWTWLLLLLNQDSYQKLIEEVDRYDWENIQSIEDLDKLVYLDAVLKESMRLYPPFWRISRQNLEKVEINHCTIAEKTNFLLSIYHLGRDSKYWDKADDFYPQRFLIAQKLPHKTSYIPFGLGPRLCVGSALAEIESKLIIFYCLKFFSIQPGAKLSLNAQMGLTLQPKDGCLVMIKSRQ